ASLSQCAGRILAEVTGVGAPSSGGVAGGRAAGVGSAVFIAHLLVAGRRLKLLGDEATERLQRPLANRLGDGFPEFLQPDRLRRGGGLGKKARSGLAGMAFLLEQCCDNLRANRQASKERKATIAETRRRVDTGSPCGSYVCPFVNRSVCHSWLGRARSKWRTRSGWGRVGPSSRS